MSAEDRKEACRFIDRQSNRSQPAEAFVSKRRSKVHSAKEQISQAVSHSEAEGYMMEMRAYMSRVINKREEV